MQRQQQATLLEPVLLRQAGLSRVFIPPKGGQLSSAEKAERTRLLSEKTLLEARIRSKSRSREQISRSRAGLANIERRLSQLAAGGEGRYELRETPEFLRQQATKRRVEERRAGLEERRAGLEGRRLGLEESLFDPRAAIERQRLQLESSLLPQRAALERARTGVETSRAGVEKLAVERARRALAGELPLDAGLLKDLASQERDVRERLFRQLGPGYETSTPGIESLREFQEFRSGALEQARRGDIAQLTSQFQPRTLAPESRFASLVPGQFASLAPHQQFGYLPPGSFMEPSMPFSQAYGSLAGQFGQFEKQLADQRIASFYPQGGGFNLGGAIGGGAGGAASGALIGSAFGGIGAIPGAVIGGIGGLFSGGF